MTTDPTNYSQQALPPPALLPFWHAYLSSTGDRGDATFYESFYFADSEDVANNLGELVLAGRKRATAALVWVLEAEGKRPPEPGDLSIVTDWSGKPLCIIETTGIEVLPFEEVTAEFAETEGEGDRSLRYWREEHWAFFSRGCRRLGREPTNRMPVLCERFRVVFRPPRESA